MEHEDTVRQLAHESLDATILEGGWTDTDRQSYVHGYMSGFRVVEWSIAGVLADRAPAGPVRDWLRAEQTRVDAEPR